MPRRTVDEITEQAALLLGEYVRDGRTRTDLLKRVADLIVDLRSRHTLADGRPDWSGRSPEYREAIREVYRRARVPEERLDTVQTALRYHVGNILRERADAGDLENVGLTNVAPRIRLQRRKDRLAALAATVEGVDDPLRHIVYAEALIEFVTAGEVAGFSGKERVAARKALETIQRHATDLLAVLDAAPTRGRGARNSPSR